MPLKDNDMTTSLGEITQKRQEERARVNLDGPTLRQANGMIGSIKLHDVSSRGFRTDWPEKLLPGEKVWLKVPVRSCLETWRILQNRQSEKLTGPQRRL